MIKIVISLPKRRTDYGELVVRDDDRLLLPPFLVLGKGGGSRSAHSSDWRLKNNDTPLGEYLGSIVPASHRVVEFGAHERILLDPIGGDALVAKNLGRSELMIHPGRSQHTLWSTFGCIRDFDVDHVRLIKILKQYDLMSKIPISIKGL